MIRRLWRRVLVSMLSLLSLFACSPAETPAAPDPCAVMATPAPGPLSGEIRPEMTPLQIAEVRIREARLSSDPGFYTLADQAVSCALSRAPSDPDALALRAHILVQVHRFADAEAVAEPLAFSRGAWTDWMVLGDARMEQGDLEGAGVAYDKAMGIRPGLPLYDRAAWLWWMRGDMDAALKIQKMAASSGSPRDPEPLAWALTRLGWLKALQGQPAPELDVALKMLPDYVPALFYRGRVRIYIGEVEGAAADLISAGATVEARWALAELGPNADIRGVALQDPRSYAMWLAPQDPALALRLLSEELSARQDAVTRAAHAWALHHAGRAEEARAEIRAALDTGCIEPRVLLYGGVILEDPELLKRAGDMGPGLLPSERSLL